MKKLMLFAASFLFAAVSAYAQQPSTGAAEAAVPIEEYVPKVIIEGKWGTGPGEFGRQSDVDFDFKPESLAVDSKGNIYVLDFVNNRIQKFSGEGRHLKDIEIDGLRGPVGCWTVRHRNKETGESLWSYCEAPVKPEGVPDGDLRPYVWPPEAQGINIVIDGKDDIYYYLKRNKDGKESGEVWQFRNDKLINKTSKKNGDNSRQAMSAATYVDLKIDADVKDSPGGKDFFAVDRKNRKISFQLESGEELYGARRVLYNEASKKWAVRVRKNGKIWDKIFSPSGKLLGVSEVPLLSEFQDFKGSYYFIETSSSGIMIRKNELVRKLR